MSLTDRCRYLARARRVVRDTLPAIVALYGDAKADAVLAALLTSAATALAERSQELAALDATRESDPQWFQAPDRLGYVAYCEQFGPMIKDVERRVPYLSSLGVTYFHLMKVIAPRPEPNDGGFAVLDYRDVDPALGSISDLRSLATTLRNAGISLCIDVVMNHTAREHAWAAAARSGDLDKREYYITYPDRTEPDDWERSLPQVFPEMAPGNFTWEAELDAWVWTTFNSYQWDLNYGNPKVLVEMLDVMLHLANLGVDALRLDAVAFTWKVKGTDCQNQPEAHLIAQILRQFTNLAAPGVLVKAEAIVGPRQLTAYLGEHGAQGQRAECQLAYHNQLMVMIWSALASRDAVLLSAAMRRLPPTPHGAAWATYIRCHDDIGWAVDDVDAASVGIDAPRHRRFLADFYRGDFPGSFAVGASFSVNEETGDERTCGSTASLAGLDRAQSSGDEGEISRAVQRIGLAYGLAASFGMPLLYMGDELAMCNDHDYLDDPVRSADSRWMQRPRMDWDRVARASVDGTVEHRVMQALGRLFRARADTPALTQGGHAWIVDTEDPRVFGFGRYHAREGRLLGLANVSDNPVSISADMLSRVGISGPAREVLDAPGVQVSDGRIRIPPLTLAWFTDDTADHPVPSR
jgi:amylosucrase